MLKAFEVDGVASPAHINFKPVPVYRKRTPGPLTSLCPRYGGFIFLLTILLTLNVFWERHLGILERLPDHASQGE